MCGHQYILVYHVTFGMITFTVSKIQVQKSTGLDYRFYSGGTGQNLSGGIGLRDPQTCPSVRTNVRAPTHSLLPSVWASEDYVSAADQSNKKSLFVT